MIFLPAVPIDDVPVGFGVNFISRAEKCMGQACLKKWQWEPASGYLFRVAVFPAQRLVVKMERILINLRLSGYCPTTRPMPRQHLDRLNGRMRK